MIFDGADLEGAQLVNTVITGERQAVACGRVCGRVEWILLFVSASARTWQFKRAWVGV